MNKIKIAEYNKEYNKTHKLEIAAKQKEYRETHKAEKAEYLKKYNKIHKLEIAAKKKEYNKKYNKINKIEVAIKKKKYNKEYDKTAKRRFSICKSDAAKRNYNFELTFDQFEKLITSNCIYCGDTGFGVDRANNKIGYTLNNSVSCCSKCNYIKKDYSIDELKVHILKMYNHLFHS